MAKVSTITSSAVIVSEDARQAHLDLMRQEELIGTPGAYSRGFAAHTRTQQGVGGDILDSGVTRDSVAWWRYADRTVTFDGKNWDTKTH